MMALAGINSMVTLAVPSVFPISWYLPLRGSPASALTAGIMADDTAPDQASAIEIKMAAATRLALISKTSPPRTRPEFKKRAIGRGVGRALMRSQIPADQASSTKLTIMPASFRFRPARWKRWRPPLRSMAF